MQRVSRRWWAATAARLAALASLLALGACRTVPATQVLVYFHAEPATSGLATQLRVQVIGVDGELVEDRTDPLAPSGIAEGLARVPLVPRDGDANRRFRVTGTLIDASGAELATISATSGYVEQELRELHLWFDADCLGVMCPVGQTCSAGSCVGDCFRADAGQEPRSTPECRECEVCSGGACAPRPAGTECGCPGESCDVGGRCVVERRVLSAFAGFTHTCAGLADGLWCWGGSPDSRAGFVSSSTPSPTRVDVEMFAPLAGSAGEEHSCFADGSNRVTCFGANDRGQLGTGMTSAPGGPSTIGTPGLRGVDVGWDFACALGAFGTDAGRVYCWGDNQWGVFGNRDEVSSVLVPTTPTGSEGARYMSVAAGGFQACAIRDDGRLFCWGFNNSGEVGTGAGIATEVWEPTETSCTDGTCPSDWRSLGLGRFHSCAIRADGELYCWGGNLNGQLGAPTSATNSLAPVRVDGGPFTSVDAGHQHTCARTRDGRVLCWGANGSGQIGSGRTDAIVSRPTAVVLPRREPVRSIALGATHSCLLYDDGALYCWGSNVCDPTADTPRLCGQLGLGAAATDPSVGTPRRVCFP